MMRTNSRGSVVSGSEELLKKEREVPESLPLLLQKFFTATDNTAPTVGPHHLNPQFRAGTEPTEIEDSDGSLGSPASTSLEDRFEALSIPEESEAM
jgi:serine/threonine-protein kinase RIM15